MIRYQIADEPAPSKLARFAVNPVYPMLAAMLGGVWFAWPWFAFNGFAIGSPTRRVELAWLVGGLIVPPTIGWAVSVAYDNGLLASGVPANTVVPYLLLLVVVVKLVVVYAVFLLQSRTVEIYEYYGGKLASGVLPLVAAFYLGDKLLVDLPFFLWLMLT